MTLQINPPVAEWSVCPYCKNKFPPKPGKIYCCANHKKHMRRRREEAAAQAARRKNKCPTPKKKKYATEEAAAKFNRYGNRPYGDCKCGWWHTSSKGK